MKRTKFGLPHYLDSDDFLAPHAEELFRIYILELGTARSYEKVSRICQERGWVNKQGKANKASILKAIWRWATRIENFDKAYAIYQEAARNEGKFITPEEFKNRILLQRISSAHQHTTQAKVDRFLRRNGYTLSKSS